MKLTEDLSKVDDQPMIEELIGDLERTGDDSRLTPIKRTIEAFILAPARIAWGDWRAQIGFSIVLLFVFMGTIWHRFYPEAYINSAPRLVQPFDSRYTHQVFGIEVWQYPLGTNDNGQGILQRIVNAAPDMVELVLAGAIVSVGIAIVVGIGAGYKGGTVDRVLMTLTDILLVIPGLPLIVMITAIIQPRDPFFLGMLLAIDNWPGLARALRSQVLTMREESYVEASRAMGISTGVILGVDIVPQLMPYILINAAGAGKGVITEAVALYFLNFLPTTAPTWGKMLDRAREFGAIENEQHFYMILWPMVVLAGISFGLVLLAQGLDQIFNPRLRARHIRNDREMEEDEGSQTNA